ncbi:MAG: hypothetical protein ACE5Q6_08240 [Dehalococcoidia bacterium]
MRRSRPGSPDNRTGPYRNGRGGPTAHEVTGHANVAAGSNRRSHCACSRSNADAEPCAKPGSGSDLSAG